MRKDNDMEKPKLVYTTFIRTTPKKLWAAITKPEFTRQYWGGARERLRLEERFEMGTSTGDKTSLRSGSPAKFWKALRPNASC